MVLTADPTEGVGGGGGGLPNGRGAGGPRQWWQREAPGRRQGWPVGVRRCEEEDKGDWDCRKVFMAKWDQDLTNVEALVRKTDYWDILLDTLGDAVTSKPKTLNSPPIEYMHTGSLGFPFVTTHTATQFGQTKKKSIFDRAISVGKAYVCYW